MVQAAAGGVGLYLLQLAKHFSIEQVIAIASSGEKIRMLKRLGADVAINYTDSDWAAKVKAVTNNRGVDVVLQMSSGAIGEQSFELPAPGGRIVLFGAQNYNDTISTSKVRQLIWQNQTLMGFAFPALPASRTAESVPELMSLVENGTIKTFAEQRFSLSEAPIALETLASRKTIGKVVLVP